MAYFLSPVLNEQQFDANGNPLNAGQIETYLAGTTTPDTTYKTSTGTAHSNPIILDSSGNYPTGTQLWLEGGKTYKFVVKTSVATGSVTLRTIDNITPINDTASSADEWSQYTATAFAYLSATSFSVVGDQTNIFQVNRRVKTQNTGGTIYSTVTNAVYGAPNTTVTVSNDSGTLDAGLSAVYYAILSAANPSVPAIYAKTTGSATFAGQLSAPTFAFSGDGALVGRSELSISATVAANAMTITLAACTLSFRNPTITSGAPVYVTISTPLSITIPTGATLGASNNVFARFVPFVAYNGGSPVLGVINLAGGANLDETSLISPTTISAGATSASTFYSASAVGASSPFRVVGNVDNTQVTAGTYAAAPSVVRGASSSIFARTLPIVSMIRLNTANGNGSTNTAIRRFTNVVSNMGADMTLTQSATLGDSVTINSPGVYAISYADNFSGANESGLSLNSTQLTTSISLINVADRLLHVTTGGASSVGVAAWTGFLPAGSVIRPHTAVSPAAGTNDRSNFTIARVS